jgi:hypothetical protein
VGVVALGTGVTGSEALEAPLVPTPFTATTVTVYAVPLVRPVIVRGEDAPLAVVPPGFAVAVYEVMAEPPVLAGAENETTSVVFPAVTETFCGTLGTVAGVTELLATDALESPTPFVALTVKVYEVPLVRPVTVIGLADPDCVIPPGLLVTV